MSEPKYKIEQEYDVLRTELSDGKKYVFERPLLIFTIGAALFKFDTNTAPYWPAIINGLLLFNFWFTINRLESMARIIAYIQLMLDNKSIEFHGWETSLRFHRKWLKINNLKIEKINIQYPGIYDNLGFYPKLYLLHIIMSVLVTIAMFSLFCNEPKAAIDGFTYFFVSATSIFQFGFFFYAITKSPKKLQKQIEQHRVVWECVFADWNNLSSETSKEYKIEAKPQHKLKLIGEKYQRNILVIKEMKFDNPTIESQDESNKTDGAD
jgi:hypothetical protein